MRVEFVGDSQPYYQYKRSFSGAHFPFSSYWFEFALSAVWPVRRSTKSPETSVSVITVLLLLLLWKAANVLSKCIGGAADYHHARLFPMCTALGWDLMAEHIRYNLKEKQN